MKNYYNYWYGSEVSSYGLEKGKVDYSCLANALGGIVLNNYIMNETWEIDEWNIVNGYSTEDDDDYDIYETEIYQTYIISDYGAEILMRHTDEIVYYNETLDMYVWGVTHYGTSWTYVLTDIPLEEREY